MKVAVIADQLAAPSTGIGRYVRDLLTGLASDPSVDAEVLVTRAGAAEAERIGISTQRLHLMREAPNRRAASILGGMLPVFRSVDLVHGTKHFVPLRGARTVLTVHDAFLLQERPRSIRRLARSTGYRRSLRSADHLLFTNDALREQFERDMQGLMAKRSAVFLPTSPVTSGARRPRSLSSESFILHVGDLDPRKNTGMLLDIWSSAGGQGLPTLVLAGMRHSNSAWREQVARAESLGRAQDLGEVSDEELQWLYDHACCLVNPSHGEGYGYTVIEALRSGCPVVTSPVPSLHDWEGDDNFVTCLDPQDVAAWRSAALRTSPRGAADRRAFGCEPVSPAPVYRALLGET
jgi:glycosyltransferase involved in cell wall biosynthesis